MSKNSQTARKVVKRDKNQTRRTRIVAWCVSILLLLGLLPATTSAQQFINQAAVGHILNNQHGDVSAVPDVFYEYFTLYSSRNNSVIARNTMYKVIGKGDIKLGKERSKVIELINRKLIQFVSIGDTLVVPTDFDVDFRAYTPFPKYYPGGVEYDKLFIIEKNVQAFAAYEFGKLVRWGIVNTGAKVSPTPTGRFNFNWKEEYRVSSLSPPDEPWEMYWVFNVHHERGIHIHQFAMPTGGPTSHGCVRLLEEDAKWIYNWADSWDTSLGNGFGSDRGVLKTQGTMVLIVGDDPEDSPEPFLYKDNYPVLRLVDLPEDPMSVPPGSPQQVAYDRVMGNISIDSD